MTVVALTIAGSDPSGGAGIQADLRTFAALGVIGVSVITALTVQNSLGVQGVHPVPADVLAAQLEAILSDTKVQAVKIGMLGGADQVRAVAAALRKHAPPNVVLDPVLASTGGVPLLDEEGRATLLTELMPLCDLVTPNMDEAKALGVMNARAVLVKGGHLSGEPVDRLTLPGGSIREFGGYRIGTEHTHGTGCLLSSLIAVLLARGSSLFDAIAESKNMLTASLREPTVIGRGRGYPQVRLSVSERIQFVGRRHVERKGMLRGVYVVTDTQIKPDRLLPQIVEEAIAGSACAIQLREKHLSTSRLLELSKRFRLAARDAQTLFIVNDRVDVALASDADGVHLGPDDMTPADARRLLGPDKLVGVSVASVEEARAAAPYASYFGVGAIFGSKTKLDAGAAIGVERIWEIKAAFPDIPIVAIGGINAENIALVAQAGADAAAVVSAVVAAPDMEAATRDLVARFEAGK